MKNEKGITLISLAITIIVLLILATIGINTGITTINSSKLTKFTTELKIMQTEVNELYNDKKNGTYQEIGQAEDEITDEKIKKAFNDNLTLEASGTDPDTKVSYKYYSTETIKDVLNIEGVENEFFVNVDERRVVAVEGLNVVDEDGNKKKCYTLDQLPDSLYNVEYKANEGSVTCNVSGAMVNEDRGRITVTDISYIDSLGQEGNISKWSARYRVHNYNGEQENWKTTNEFDGTEFSFEVNKLDVYDVQIFHGTLDQANDEDEINSDIYTISVGKELLPDEEEDFTDQEKRYGVIETSFLSGTSYNVTETPNRPVLESGMKAVYWAKNEEGEVDETNCANNTIEITSDNPNFKEENWYKYVSQEDNDDDKTSRWANAKTSDGSYYVWIPRYAYRIVYFSTEEDEKAYRENSTITDKITGYSDARGIITKDGKRAANVKSTTAVSVGNKKLRTHPTFDGDVNEGGWDRKLTGIWVMKFEASRADATATSEGKSTEDPKSVPGVKSWRYTSVNDMFNYSKNAYDINGQVNMILNPHLIKNSEWGAIAYLTDSSYGRNGTEVTINNNSNFITGSAGNSIGASTNVGTTTDYKSTQGILASSTGNIYGIYDLSGGLWEFVPGYYKGGDLSFGSNFATGHSDKYSTSYEGTSVNQDYIPGDATYETKYWNSDYNTFVDSSQSFFAVGGPYAGASRSGIFAYLLYTGNSIDNDNGFRMCMAIR